MTATPAPLSPRKKLPGPPPSSYWAPLLISGALTMLEVIFFYQFLKYGTEIPEGKEQAKYLAGMAVPLMGDFVVAIGTTWYVVFTFYLLKATLESRKEDTEPYLRARGFTTTKVPCEHILEGLSSVGDPLEEVYDEVAKRPQEPTAGSMRYINLTVENLNDLTTDTVSLAIRTTLINSTGGRKPSIHLSGEIKDVALVVGQTLTVTVADLGIIPHTHKLEVQVVEVRCTTLRSAKPIVFASELTELFEGVAPFVLVGTPETLLEPQRTWVSQRTSNQMQISSPRLEAIYNLQNLPVHIASEEDE